MIFRGKENSEQTENKTKVKIWQEKLGLEKKKLYRWEWIRKALKKKNSEQKQKATRGEKGVWEA